MTLLCLLLVVLPFAMLAMVLPMAERTEHIPAICKDHEALMELSLLVDDFDIRTNRDQEAVDTITASLDRVGQIDALVVTPLENGLYGILSGKTRFKGMQKLGWTHARVRVFRGKGEAEALDLAIEGNRARSAMKPSELAKAGKRLQELRVWNNSELAQAWDISPAKVTVLFSILEQDAETQAKIDAGVISQDASLQLARIKDLNQRRALIAVLEKEGKAGFKRERLASLVRRTLDGQPEPEAAKGPKRVCCHVNGVSVTLSCEGGLTLPVTQEVLETLSKAAKKATEPAELAKAFVVKRKA